VRKYSVRKKMAGVGMQTIRCDGKIITYGRRMTEEQRLRLVAQVSGAFTPGSPIKAHDLFAGRTREVEKVLGTVFQPGQHAVLYGERGVGKTSLANTLFDFLVLMGRYNYQRARVNSAAGMNFEQIWKAVFKQLKAKVDGEDIGLILPKDPHSEDIREAFELVNGPSIVIIDELDKITDPKAQVALADTIKTLSDNSVDTTLILVGVADSINQLLADHRSIERAIRQVPMPRMSKGELLEIVDKGLRQCEGLAIAPVVRERIADYSEGLPFFTHMLARESALRAVRTDRTYVIMPDLDFGIGEAVDGQLESLLEAYRLATRSPKGKNFKPVLLACALAKKDEKGFFYATHVTDPLCFITQTDYKIPAFAKHLKAFSSQVRGPILETRGRQYRFVTPLMEPYVILRGLRDGLIVESQLSHPATTSTAPEQLSLLSPSSLPGIEI
jgi:hypothetical protein